MDNQRTYSTKNLFVATFLAASNKVTFVGIQQLNHKTKLFCFAPADVALQLESSYFSGGSLPAKSLFSEYNTLKDLLFQRETNGERYEQ